MNKSSFKQYFLYKLSSLRGILVASAVLAFAGVPLTVTLIKILFGQSIKSLMGEGSVSYDLSVMLALYCGIWVIFIFLASVVLALIAPVVSFNYYNNRACVDTIGSLPLTYNQRFLGDFLAGFAASAAPYIIFLPYTLITVNSIIPQDIDKIKLEGVSGVRDYTLADALESVLPLPGYMVRYALLFAVILVSAYTFSSMIISCCGKISSSVFYTIFATFIVPGVVMSYTGFVSAGAVGVDMYESRGGAVIAIVPGGVLAEFLNFWNQLGFSGFSYFDYTVKISALSYIIMLLLTFAYAAGAYFLGKHRKTERVGRDFVYESVYAVISTIFAVGILGGIFFEFAITGADIWLIIAVVFGLAVYLAVEFSHTKSFKKLPKSMIKYAVICVVCFGFFGLTKLTESFGIADRIPNADEISKVEVYGEYLFSYDGDWIAFDDRAAIETIVSEHKKLISDKNALYTGNEIYISYKLKNGMEINRRYSSIGGDYSIKDFSDVIRTLPSSSSNIYGVLASEDYSDLVFRGYYFDRTNGEENTIQNTVEFTINPSKIEEFRQILLNDIKNNYTHYSDYGSTMGYVGASYTRNGVKKSENYEILNTYEDTLAFIRDPDNCTTSLVSDSDTEVRSYTAIINLTGNYFDRTGEYLELEFTSDSEAAKELISLLATGNDEDLSEIIMVRDDRWINNRIKITDEKRAVELIIQLAKESL